MEISQLIGSFGVMLLLLVYFLNIFGYLKSESRIFLSANVVGAGMSCLASVLINYIPFVILEATWTVVSLIALIRLFVKELRLKSGYLANVAGQASTYADGNSLHCSEGNSKTFGVDSSAE